MKLLIILGLLVLALSALAVPIGRVGAAGTGVYKNVPPWFTERLKAMNQNSSAEDFVGQYSSSHVPSYENQARMSNGTPQLVIEILAATIIVILAVFAGYLFVSEKTPEKAMEESMKSIAK